MMLRILILALAIATLVWAFSTDREVSVTREFMPDGTVRISVINGTEDTLWRFHAVDWDTVLVPVIEYGAALELEQDTVGDWFVTRLIWDSTMGIPAGGVSIRWYRPDTGYAEELHWMSWYALRDTMAVFGYTMPFGACGEPVWVD